MVDSGGAGQIPASLIRDVRLTMSTTATILEIMESWPIGLRLKVDHAVLLVTLVEGCAITEGDQSLSPGELHAGMTIRFDADDPAAVSSVEVLRG